MCYSAIIRQRAKELGIDVELRTDFGFDEYAFERSRTEPSKFRVAGADGRVFPYYFAPVLVCVEGEYEFQFMRYQLFPSSLKFKEDPKQLSLFNARRDNLLKPDGLWGSLVARRQGVVFVERFFEWVAVRDLVKAGVVSLEQVKAHFEERELARKRAALAKGKLYRPAKTALLPLLERKIEIGFSPDRSRLIVAPVVFDLRIMDGDKKLYSFALLTDEPQPEVAAAGHDRSPIFLTREAALAWLQPGQRSKLECVSILDGKEQVHYSHGLVDGVA